MRHLVNTFNFIMKGVQKNLLCILTAITLIFSVISLYTIQVNAEETFNLGAYITEADNITYYGQDSIQRPGDSANYAVYTNTSVDDSKYILYSNAVNANGIKYDLVIYPFKVTKNANVNIENTALVAQGHGGYGGYKLVITQHGNINNPISLHVIFGFSDLDLGEYVILPSNFSDIHKGTKVSKSSLSLGIKYCGDTESNTDKERFNLNCILGEIDIPTSGITFYYGSDNTRKGASITVDNLRNYINENAYTIQFNANGGTGNIPSPIIKYGDSTSTVMGDIGNSVPTRTGYTFKGWSATSTYSSSNKRIAYVAGSTGATQTSSSWTYADYCNYTGGNTSNRILTLYAQWEPVYNHTLVYDANGGIGAPANSTVTNSSSTYSMTISSTQPTREGYTFAGWNTNSDGTGTNYNVGDSVPVGANATVTLYAQWETITYSITYNGNGNTGGSTASQTKNYGIAINLQQNGFTRTGYSFKCWNTSPDGTGTSYAAGASYNTNADLTLYAQWETITYSITYNGNGNTGGSTASQTKNYGIAINLQQNGFTRTGYKFKGWNTSQDGTGTSYVAGATYNTNADLTLYAIWQPITYKITYHGNGNWNDETVDTEKTIQYRYDHPQDLSPNPFTRNAGETWETEIQNQGYTFLGWGITPNQDTPDYTDKQNIVNLTDEQDKTIDLYAIWRKDLVLTFNLQGGLYNTSPDDIQLKASVYNEQREYEFDIADGLTPENNPKWTIQENNIDAYGTWDANGINTKFTRINDKGQSYRFIGWNTDNNLKTPLTTMIVYDSTNHVKTYTIDHDETLYATWETVLIVNAEARRSLGNLRKSDGTLPKSQAMNLTASTLTTSIDTVEAVITSGEQGYYNIMTLGGGDYNIKVIFDEAITNIYKDGPAKDYFDVLNPIISTNKDELLSSDQKHSLNRNITTSDSVTTRKFYVPQYLGTERSYHGNSGVLNYTNKFIISQPSYFYRYIYNTDEIINVDFKLYLAPPGTTASTGGGTAGGGTGGTGDNETDNATTVRQFRTRILN